MTEQSPFTATGFTPSDQDTASLMAWFAEYDAHVRRNDIDAMADMARFPLTVMTNDSAGECVTRVWDRAAFVEAMSMAADPSVELDNRRAPTFLNADLAVVVTDTELTMTGDTAGDTAGETGGDTAGETGGQAAGQVQLMRYVDVMAKSGGAWKFASMIQAGWGDMLKADPIS